MINIGKYACKMLDDGWTAVTRDRSLTAQFEHSMGITRDGCEITKSPTGLDWIVRLIEGGGYPRPTQEQRTIYHEIKQGAVTVS